MQNSTLTKAKIKKNDEFYTQYLDIEKEMNAYLDFEPNAFRDKTVLLPCDDPDWSNFTKYFAQNFERFGIKKLISTSFATKSKVYEIGFQPSLLEENDKKYDPKKSLSKGKIFTIEQDMTHDGKIDIDDLQWSYLDGDGDFRSEELAQLAAEADIIVTNPPFSLFRVFLSWVIKSGKKFSIIGSMNAITYKEVFPLIKENRMWLGATGNGNDMVFAVPKGTEVKETDKQKAERLGYKGDYTRLGNSCWFTNIEHGRRHQPLSLMTLEDNKRFNKKIANKPAYETYDNYNAIEVPFTVAIPSDYSGIMGVPISFLDKYNPDQFEIVGLTKTWFGGANKVYPPQIQVSTNGKESEVTKLNDGATLELKTPPNSQTYYKVDKKIYIQLYARVLIKHKDV